MNIEQEKREVREAVWSRLEQAGQALPPGAEGRIPNFVGAQLAAERLAQHEVWRRANVIKSNPDTAQLPVRLRALADGKLLYMAVPKIADIRPFYLLDPANLNAAPADVTTGSGAADHAPKVSISEMRPVDLVVCGSVAVNRDGVRIGKGAGYSDIEVALLIEAGLVGPSTIVATTVHALQIVDGPLPESSHDVGLDLIITPDEVIECRRRPRPTGIYWDNLSARKIDAIPILKASSTGG
ncbi:MULTISPECIES: 5-formyltetrahydrofolate cyclo-ligase [unclassified Micromonospora]|uniref:5-formyltetrahydrofolate cyclo-ligase n=1 Tax=unclassified Micromonospora TaxID=2617518 RepID=UPI0022CC14E8|nr:5-formyltetrahydrofolate cyclo-ligase [Micromonospora sp. AKA38]GHJ13932.1 5-formyltetrahydrofolate cyclo-ligase [Micromonospora sp. AKA38]